VPQGRPAEEGITRHILSQRKNMQARWGRASAGCRHRRCRAAMLRCADACALIRSVSQAHHHVVLHDDIGVRTRRLRLAAHPVLMRLRVAVAIVVVCFFRRLCRCCAIESLRRRGARYCRCCSQYDANHFMSDFRRLARRITVRPPAHTHTHARARAHARIRLICRSPPAALHVP
jgi:hypothetical protein